MKCSNGQPSNSLYSLLNNKVNNFKLNTFYIVNNAGKIILTCGRKDLTVQTSSCDLDTDPCIDISMCYNPQGKQNNEYLIKQAYMCCAQDSVRGKEREEDGSSQYMENKLIY